MVRDIGLIVLGAGLLYFGAEWLVRGASGLAAKLRVRPLIIGLTVVAYGTSAPELVVGIGAALSGRGEIAFGNAVGSNIANVGLILGLTSLVSPPAVDRSLRRRELPVMLAAALAVPLLLLGGGISRVEGAALLAAAFVYTFVMVRSSSASSSELVAEAAEVASDAGAAGDPARLGSSVKLASIAALGLGCVLAGGHLLVLGASELAVAAGVSPRVVGLTIVAIGTSVPELATSLVAARRGHSDLAVGNVVGSNIFNVLLILGAAGLARPFAISLGESRVEIVGLLLMTGAAVLFLSRSAVSRTAGAVLVVGYVLFLGVLAISP